MNFVLIYLEKMAAVAILEFALPVAMAIAMRNLKANAIARKIVSASKSQKITLQI